jgi:hypothetical protein
VSTGGDCVDGGGAAELARNRCSTAASLRWTPDLIAAVAQPGPAGEDDDGPL